MHIPLLQDIIIILTSSALLVFLFSRYKIPSIIGFLVTGIIIGPYGLSLIHATEEVEVLAEIGVILLLFVIGMELSLKELARIRNTVLIGGALQVLLTIAAAGGIYYWVSGNWQASLFVGFLFSLSSTAIVLKSLQDTEQMGTPHGNNALGILIFQDIIVVPLMLITPLLAGASGSPAKELVLLLIKSAGLIVLTLISARYIVPKIMYAIAKTRNKELFLLTVMTMCFLVAFLTSEAGLSLALGAFLAGLIVSDSEYNYQATSVILPFRELFTSFFFVSVGMLLNTLFFFEHLFVILGIVLAVFLFKTTLVSIAIWILRYPPRTILMSGLALFQVGEFAFILSKVGIEYGLLTEETNQYFLSVSILSMILTPFVILYLDRIANWVFRGKQNISKKQKHTEDAVSNHLVIVGYGINGSNVAKAAKFSGIQYCVIELNPKTVIHERNMGTPIYFGDATEAHILEKAHISTARVAVIAISDPKATKVILQNIREMSSSIYVIVRTRYVKDSFELFALGANDVIPEEFETSIEIFSRVMQNFLIPEGTIHQFAERIRKDNYDLFKNEQVRPRRHESIVLADFQIQSMKLRSDHGPHLHKSLEELDLRKRFGINILGITRQNTFMHHLSPEEHLKQGDILYFQGSSEQIDQFKSWIHN